MVLSSTEEPSELWRTDQRPRVVHVLAHDLDHAVAIADHHVVQDPDLEDQGHVPGQGQDQVPALDPDLAPLTAARDRAPEAHQKLQRGIK